MCQRTWPVGAFLLLLAACMPEPPRPGVATTPLGALTDRDIDTAKAAVLARLETLGFTVEGRDASDLLSGRIEHGAPDSWAACDRVLVRESDNRSRTHWASADDVQARLTVRFSELAGRTSVTVSARFEGVYLDRFTNTRFTRACASNGALEPLVLGAATGD